MNLDVLLLVSGGLVAILASAAILAQGARRSGSLLGAVSIAALGILQFGWARAAFDLEWGVPQYWFEHALAFSLPVSLCWVLFGVTLAHGSTAPTRGLWRLYILVQALASIAALAAAEMIGLPPGTKGATAFTILPHNAAVIVAIAVNLVLITASFESHYLALAGRRRRAFRAGLLGVLLSATYFAYVGMAGLATRTISLGDLSVGAISVMATSLLVTVSLLRGRIAEVAAARPGQPIYTTTSLMLAVVTLGLTSVALGVAERTGISLARLAWLAAGLLGTAAIAALALSSGLQRRLQRWIDPQRYARRVDRRAIRAQVRASLGRLKSLDSAISVIPESARALSRAEPITLFLAWPNMPEYRVVASTLVPLPRMSVAMNDPLARELRRADHAFRLRGREHDLDLIPIYVENGHQLEGCAAEFAVPMHGADELIGFLLCGRGQEPPEQPEFTLQRLEALAAEYTRHLERYLIAKN